MVRKYGSRADVYDGLATLTRGRLSKDDLQLNEKTGKLVSKKKSAIAKENYAKFGFNKRKAIVEEKVEEEEKKPKKRRRRKKKDE